MRPHLAWSSRRLKNNIKINLVWCFLHFKKDCEAVMRPCHAVCEHENKNIWYGILKRAKGCMEEGVINLPPNMCPFSTADPVQILYIPTTLGSVSQSPLWHTAQYSTCSRKYSRSPWFSLPSSHRMACRESEIGVKNKMWLEKKTWTVVSAWVNSQK